MPNRSRGHHWTAINSLRMRQKRDAKYETLAVLGGRPCPIPADAKVDVEVRVTWPNGRKMADLDNLIAATKGLIDGVHLALGRDDGDMGRLCVEQVRAEDGDKAGMVEVVVTW